MFLASLNLEQRKNFLGLAQEILVVDDGHIDQHEETYLRGLCSEMSLSMSEKVSVDKSKLRDVFKEKEEKKILLMELVALCYSNKDYHEEQDEFTDKICALIDMPTEDLRAIERLFLEFNKVQDRIIDFIEA